YRTYPVSHYQPNYDIESDHGTTHISVLDSNDMAVSLTSTINLAFGSQLMDPETGVILNDQMDDFSTTNKTNYFGLRPSPNNKIVPSKRPLSSTVPTIIENRDGSVEMVVGGSGGSRILTAVAQTILNALEFDMRLDQAIDSPRIHHQLLPNYAFVEDELSPHIREALKRLGHEASSRGRVSHQQL
ncbi:hypothetical protein EV182_004426, partial [Spiromyces aspiralis]